MRLVEKIGKVHGFLSVLQKKIVELLAWGTIRKSPPELRHSDPYRTASAVADTGNASYPCRVALVRINRIHEPVYSAAE